MNPFERPERVEDDPAGMDRGQRSQASLDEEMREYDQLLEDMFEQRQARWLTDLGTF